MKPKVRPVHCKILYRVHIATNGSIDGGRDCSNGTANGIEVAMSEKKQVATLEFTKAEQMYLV